MDVDWANASGGGAEPPLAARWNASAIDFAEITMDRNFALLLVSLATALLWALYATYYNSRVLGFLLTRLVNRFYFQDDNFKIGSFTLNALSGKIMFRDIVYVTYDYTLRVQDGYLIFRWWRSYVPKDVSEDLSHSDTRLSIMLNGFELHFYNRCDLYNELEKTFGLEPVIKHEKREESADRERAMNDANEKRRRARDAVRSEAARARTWRDLVPVIKADVCAGRVVFGNRLVPTSLSVAAEEVHLLYSTKPAASRLDPLMHFAKGQADNVKVLLAPSPSYTAMADEPPRYMGEGFVVMSSNHIEVYFYMDEPGLVPDRPVLLQLANGDIVESAPPIWGVDIKCGKGTDFSYGPWADRQREHLFKFFFPPNYKNLEITPQPKPGDRRQMQSFDIRLSTLNEATIDILFTKNKETNAVHVNIGAGSYLEVTLPWIVLQDGYTTKITGQLLHLEATTSLQYRSLVESETLEYTVKCHYPLVWNHHQCWQLSLTGCKATAQLVYTHIDFFLDLINDWSTKSRPDILHFVPYTWKISLLLKECEVVTISNQYNWIDCSSTNQENNHVAFCGDLLDVSFDLPFVDFLPDVMPLKIWVQGEAVDMSLYLPDVNTSRLLLLAIDKNMKLLPCRLKASKWRRKCVKSQGWIDCWSVPIVALSVRYRYHPAPPLGPEPQADITTPEKEEILLSPIRIPRMRKQPQMNWTIDGSKFDRTTLAPDKVTLELEVGPSVLLAYGTIITSFMNLLENIFGEDQTFTDMQKTPNMGTGPWPGESNSKSNDKNSVNRQNEIATDDSSECGRGPLDPRQCRPLDVAVSIIIHDVQAHLVKNCSESEPPCPVLLVERFGFEMDRSFRETKLQLLLSPSVLVSANNLSRTNPTNSGALYQGHLMLSSFQLRGHGFFSDADRSAEEDTVEYAWMMELQLGQLTGRLTLPQLYQVVTALETFALLVCDDENELCPPDLSQRCHHGLDGAHCPEADLPSDHVCPTADEIKYRMVRVAVDLVDVHVADTGTALQARVSPARLALCNLHGPGCAAGLAALLPSVRLALYTQCGVPGAHHSGGSTGSQGRGSEGDGWLGVGSVSLGPVLVEAASALPRSPENLHSVQHRFLKLHDEKTRRLWFMWPGEGRTAQCGCVGGCAFFGSNRNGPAFLKPSAVDLQQGVNVAAFNVLDTPGEFGYGQSVLHAGRLVFHTPPYDTLNVCLQPSPAPSPQPPQPTPARSPQSAERRSLTRRFSYSSMNKGSSNLLVSSTKSDVPYARLVDSAAPLGSSKIDSDSKLNKTILNVPQLESSVSDSKLALSCSVKEISSTMPRKTPPGGDAGAPLPPARTVGVSDSHYSLDSQAPPEDAPPEVQRTTSITSENQSEAFFSADEDMFPSRSSSLKHSFGSRRGPPSERWARAEPAPVGAGPVPAPADTASTLSAGAVDSESGSVSSTSFISAISSQEDMTLVDLHMQAGRPIAESPLLMASYAHSLPRYRCANWAACSLPSGADAFAVPLFRRADDGTLVYVGQRYLPHFEPLGRPDLVRLVPRAEGPGAHGPHSTLAPHFNSQVRAHPYPPGWWDVPQGAHDDRESAAAAPAAGDAADCSESRTGVLMRLRGDVDVMLTPLVLESAQKFVESLTPVLGSVHPVTVIGHLRLLCVAGVRRANALKRARHVRAWLPRVADGAAYEHTLCERVQASLSVPRVNMLLLQASVVEDLISFAALDHVQDLTCVSLLAVCAEDVAGRLARARSSREAMRRHQRPPPRALQGKKSFGIMRGARGAQRPAADGEPVYIETSRRHCADTALTLHVGKIHGQLRRIRSESSQLKDATVTGIPSQHSKVSFKLVRAEPSVAADAAGYIMVECGLEGVAVRVAQHAQSHKPGVETAPAPAVEPRPERDRGSKGARTSGFEDLFRKRESTSKPGTPNLSGAPPAPSTPAPDERPADAALTARDAGNTSSCSVDLKVVWFNFAAPPRTPITRKIDYTRLDWNLLSTASPAISAWLNPSSRLAERVVALYRAHARRVTATAASLMAAALDLAPHHAPPKSRYGRHTPMARQLREEPSLQLCGVLLRHALQADAAALQADLAERHLPSLSTLRQGVIVLSRQWKNILYSPLLLEHNYKSKVMRPLNVTFALPDLLEEAAWREHAAEGGGGGALDEHCLLLDMDLDLDGLGAVPAPVPPATATATPPADAGASAGAGAGARGLSLPFARRAPLHDDAFAGYGALREETGAGAAGSNPSLYSAGSDDNVRVRSERAREDLYQWMAKQEPFKPGPRGAAGAADIPAARLQALAAARAGALPACSLYPLQGSLMLLDAHLVFRPLLAALGVSPHQVPHGTSKDKSGEGGGGGTAPVLESLGSKLSLLAWVDTVRVDIVVSEPTGARGRAGGGSAAGGGEAPAFLCEKVSLDVDLQKVADVAVEELVRRRNVLYISRGQLKRHISTMINFNLGVRFISQQVNMPLLRLLHQISNMYQNVKEAQLELRAQAEAPRRARLAPSAHALHHTSSSGERRPAPARPRPCRANRSESAVSDYRENLVSVSSLEKDTLTLGSRWDLAEPAPPPPRPPPPVPAARPRPQSFAQKLRSTGKSVKGKLGYSSLGEGAHTPMFGADLTAPAPAPVAPPAPTTVGESGEAGDKLAPRCWRTVHQLLELYANMPDAETITHRFSVSTDIPEAPRAASAAGTSAAHSGVVVIGVARIHRTRLLASLSGLKLEAELTALQASLSASRARQWALSGTLGRAAVVLLEGPAAAPQTVLRVQVGKSQALHSWDAGRTPAAAASALLSVGGVRVELPQHPVALHGVMTRSSRQLSSTLQELGVTRAASRLSRGAPAAAEPDEPVAAPPPAPRPPPRAPPAPPTAPAALLDLQFSVAVQSVSVTAALLPSLQAQYKMEQVAAAGVCGARAHFTVELPQHSLSFVTRVAPGAANLPAAAAVALPAVHAAARVLDAAQPAARPDAHGAVLRAGRYLAATADIGLFEHTLSTDLLNHLVFVQKVFMKEVNEVVQKVYGGEKPVPLWGEEEVPGGGGALSRLLFSLLIRIKRIQLTATTPSSSAVRLETGAVELELSNRVQNVPASRGPAGTGLRLFARAQVDVNLSLGQLLRNAVFEEAEPEFQQHAFFDTRISMRNAFQEETEAGAGGCAGGGAGGAEVVLITLKRPLVYVQPVAVDRAILVWLNYKNAYEYWTLQRRSLNQEVLAATQQLIEKVQLTSQMSAPSLSTLFLQLNVDDIGICLPLNTPPMAAACGEGETRGAVVVTLESTSVSACSSGALVSKGRFVGLCLRFAADFEASLDDWQPRADEPALNVCRVSEGTYEVCSRTAAARHHENAKWFLNVSWQMEGVDILLDVSVGKQLSALGHTLTMLTGLEEEEGEPPPRAEDESEPDEEDDSRGSQDSVTRRRAPDARPDARTRCRLVEHELSEQARIISDLRALGASHHTVELEVRRLRDLEALVFKDFRRDMLQKLRRQSVRAGSITRGKLGLGSNRSRSFVAPSPPPAARRDVDRSLAAGESGETLLDADGDDERLADITEGGSWSSTDSEPPPRAASLRAPAAAPPAVQRQSSLPAHHEPWPAAHDRDPDPEDEPVELRRHTAAGGGGGAGEGRAGKAKAAEPNIDFELDVKVHVNSGKCVLHTKDGARDDDARTGSRMRVGRSASGGLGEPAGGGSPGAARRRPAAGGVAGGGPAASAGAAAGYSARHHAAVDVTVFRVPGLDFKVHYESKTLPEEGASPAGVGPAMAGGAARKAGLKKAALLAWITLQSIPEETVISPHILEFLEQALEPIPLKLAAHAPESEGGGGEGAEGGEAEGVYGQYVYASFPVDVIVHFHMQPSTFRFSCLPASRVECLLRLPSLQIVFSSKRAADPAEEAWEGAAAGVASGGLSVTGCLADFSVYVFHPYGGKKSSLKEPPPGPHAPAPGESERKDSLSINVEFVKFHLARSRKLHLHPDPDRAKATVRFSTIVDVGSAWFKYDMRRLSEILAFPKAWYRRTIVRRMFLGDLSLARDRAPPARRDRDAAGPSGAAPLSPVLPQREKIKTDHQKTKERVAGGGAGEAAGGAAWETLVLFAVNFTRLNVHMNMGNVMGNVSWQSRDFNCSGRLSIGSSGHRNMLLGVALQGSALDARGGIVGGAISLSAIHTYVHISEEAGLRPAHVCGVRLAALELRLEYMGTPVLLARVSRLAAAARDEWLAPPAPPALAPHRPTARPAVVLTHGSLAWQQLQLLMARSTTPDLLKMQLKLEEFFTQQFKSSKRVLSALHPEYRGRRHWERRAPAAAVARDQTAAAGEAAAPSVELRHHRHWQDVLRQLAGVRLSAFSAPLPADGIVVGGTMELRGAHVSLACFHGNSFKAKSWALFSLKDPCLSFATEAQQVADDSGELEVHVAQSLTASLGGAEQAAGVGGAGAGGGGHQSMGTVCRMTRALLFPPQFKTLREWFTYAFASSEIDAIELFPSLEREGGGGGGGTGSTERGASAGGGAAERGKAGGGAGAAHQREVIFALPAMQLHLRTQHRQAPRAPTHLDARPAVECSFITEFEDHIFVSVDAEAFLFLHDLISSYIKEKDRLAQVSVARAPRVDAAGAAAAAAAGVGQDYRDYRCVTWHLEPTVRLLSWAGKSIEPYGVDYILQKLGFSHARTTIPKWLQRGALDPLDKLLALALLRLVAILPPHHHHHT